MALAIQRLLRQSVRDRKRIDAFLERHDFPLQEGAQTTFVFRGEVDEVRLQHWVYGLASSRSFERVEGTDLWYLTLELPPCSRIEYKLEVVEGEERRWIRDPLNPHLARDPFGANSVCATPGYETPEWTRPDPEARPGRIERFEVSSKVFRETRPVDVYLPARFSEARPYPLLVVHDGTDYQRYADLRTVLDNLIYRLEIPPLLVALTDSPRRLQEYGADRRHARFVAEELVPRLERVLPIDDDPASRGLMGASFGAVASLSTAWRYPGRFDRLLLQSGSFAFSDFGELHERGATFDPVVRFMNAFRRRPGRPTERLFLSCGIYEPLIYENRSLVPQLQAAGMTVRFEEARDGHNWLNWRDRLRAGLSWLFPGPLWMVYE